MVTVVKSGGICHVSLDQTGRMLIPAVLRQRFGIAPGDAVVLEPSDTGIVVRPLDAVIREVQAYFADVAPRDVLISEELIRERRAEAEREERD